MPEQTAPVVPIIPTTNGVPKGAPQPSTAPPPASAAPDSQAELVGVRAELKRLSEEALKKNREHITERRKWDGEKKTLGEKLKMADEYERLKKHANINEAAVAKALWGDRWHERLTAVQVNGGAPTADSVAFELERVREETTKAIEDRYAKERESSEEADRRATDAQMRAFNASAVEFSKSATKEYPIFEQFGDAAAIGRTLVARIRAEHDRTMQRDEETGTVVVPGRVLSFKEAAEALETDLIAIAKRAAGLEKYQPGLREVLQPTKPSGTVSPPSQKSSQLQSSSQQQSRRTLSNDLTGSTPGDAPKHRTDAERLAASTERYNAIRFNKS